MITFDADRVRENVRRADTEDLLDRATVYREEMEPEALKIVNAELAARDVTIDQIQSHLEARRGILARPEGGIRKCSLCHRPAVRREWEWHRLFGRLPVFPRLIARCREHEGN